MIFCNIFIQNFDVSKFWMIFLQNIALVWQWVYEITFQVEIRKNLESSFRKLEFLQTVLFWWNLRNESKITCQFVTIFGNFWPMEILPTKRNYGTIHMSFWRKNENSSKSGNGGPKSTVVTICDVNSCLNNVLVKIYIKSPDMSSLLYRIAETLN